MSLQEQINELLREQSGEITDFMKEEYEETYAKVNKITRMIKLLFEGKLNNVLEEIHGLSSLEMFNKALTELSDAYSYHHTVVEERGYYKGLRDGLKLASGFEIMQIPVAISLLEKPHIQLNITDVDNPDDDEPV